MPRLVTLSLGALMALPVIPALIGSLGGGTHLVTCRGPVFSPVVQAGGATIGEGVVVRRNSVQAKCYGLSLSAIASPIPATRSAGAGARNRPTQTLITLAVGNTNPHHRNTSVVVQLEGRRIVVPLGATAGGVSTRRTILVRVRGRVQLQLLVGP